MKPHSLALVTAFIGAVLCTTPQPGAGQVLENSAAVPLAATAPTSVPALIPYAGFAFSADGKPLTNPVSITFLIYKDPQGGEALWSEAATVTPDAAGKFSVQLGSTLPSGLPADLFVNGEARWLELQIAGQAPSPRTLLTSVPYAMKAADAESLTGHVASDFVTQAQLAASFKTTAAALAAQSIEPLVAGTVTGSGTTGYVPLWTGASALGTSVLNQVGTGASAKVGIKTTNPATSLDVNGNETLRGYLTMLPASAATATAGVYSPLLELSASSFLAGGAAKQKAFAWQRSRQATTPLLLSGSQATVQLRRRGVRGHGTFHRGQRSDRVCAFADFPFAATLFPKGQPSMPNPSSQAARPTGCWLRQTPVRPRRGPSLARPPQTELVSRALLRVSLAWRAPRIPGTAFTGLQIPQGLQSMGGVRHRSGRLFLVAKTPQGPRSKSPTSPAERTHVQFDHRHRVSGSSSSGSGVYANATTGAGITAVASTGFAGNFSNIATYNATISATNAVRGMPVSSTITALRMSRWQGSTFPPTAMRLEPMEVFRTDTRCMVSRLPDQESTGPLRAGLGSAGQAVLKAFPGEHGRRWSIRLLDQRPGGLCRIHIGDRPLCLHQFRLGRSDPAWRPKHFVGYRRRLHSGNVGEHQRKQHPGRCGNRLYGGRRNSSSVPE